MSTKNKLIADKYIEFLDRGPQLSPTPELLTWDDFFDWADVPQKDRPGFFCAHMADGKETRW